MGQFGKKGKGGQEQDLANYSNEQLEELIAYYRKAVAETERKSTKKWLRQYLRKYEYVLSRR